MKVAMLALEAFLVKTKNSIKLVPPVRIAGGGRVPFGSDGLLSHLTWHVLVGGPFNCLVIFRLEWQRTLVQSSLEVTFYFWDFLFSHRKASNAILKIRQIVRFSSNSRVTSPFSQMGYVSIAEYPHMINDLYVLCLRYLLYFSYIISYFVAVYWHS